MFHVNVILNFMVENATENRNEVIISVNASVKKQ